MTKDQQILGRAASFQGTGEMGLAGRRHMEGEDMLPNVMYIYLKINATMFIVFFFSNKFIQSLQL